MAGWVAGFKQGRVVFIDFKKLKNFYQSSPKVVYSVLLQKF